MKLNPAVLQLRQWVLPVLFPAVCVLCKDDVSYGHPKPVCGTCLGHIASNPRWQRFPSAFVDECFTAGVFEGSLRDLLHLYKYQGKEYLSKTLVDVWTKAWNPIPPEIDFIVPVPMPFWREIKRGYNQAAHLARELGRRWRIPVMEKCLGRRLSRSQIHLTRIERKENAFKSFSIDLKKIQGEGKTVLLVDDILTTGATLAACAHLLKIARVQRVIASAVAREELTQELD